MCYVRVSTQSLSYIYNPVTKRGPLSGLTNEMQLTDWWHTQNKLFGINSQSVTEYIHVCSFSWPLSLSLAACLDGECQREGYLCGRILIAFAFHFHDSGRWHQNPSNNKRINPNRYMHRWAASQKKKNKKRINIIIYHAKGKIARYTAASCFVSFFYCFTQPSIKSKVPRHRSIPILPSLSMETKRKEKGRKKERKQNKRAHLAYGPFCNPVSYIIPSTMINCDE